MRLTTTRLLVPAALALALAACAEEEPTYEADAEDLSGGELQVADPDAEGVPVDLPETEMTNVPPEPVYEEMPPEVSEEMRDEMPE